MATTSSVFASRENQVGTGKKNCEGISRRHLGNRDKWIETPQGTETEEPAIKSCLYVSICFCFDKPSGPWFSCLENDVNASNDFAFPSSSQPGNSSYFGTFQKEH